MDHKELRASVQRLAPRTFRCVRSVKAALREGRLRARALGVKHRPLPNFLIIGAQKAGTTSLFQYLAEHPDVVVPIRKEVHFFDLSFRRGERWYRAFFPPVARQSTVEGQSPIQIGEATPYYLFHPHAPARAHSMIPAAKMIVLVRNPVKRAFSHYQHNLRKGIERLSFEEAIEREWMLLDREHRRMLWDPAYNSRFHQRYAYIARGCYADQLERWARYFPLKQIMVVRSEQLFVDPGRIYGRVLRFLGLRSYDGVRFTPRNRHRHQSMIRPATQEYLQEYYEPHNRRIVKWLAHESGSRPLGW